MCIRDRISSMCFASLMAVWPPNWTTQASGFSVAMMLSTLSGFRGSKYRRSPVSKSVETVSGLLLTRMASQPWFFRRCV